MTKNVSVLALVWNCTYDMQKNLFENSSALIIVHVMGFFLGQFFTTKPYACEPSSLPKYPPSKEMDAKLRDEEARRWMTTTCF